MHQGEVFWCADGPRPGCNGGLWVDIGGVVFSVLMGLQWGAAGIRVSGCGPIGLQRATLMKQFFPGQT